MFASCQATGEAATECPLDSSSAASAIDRPQTASQLWRRMMLQMGEELLPFLVIFAVFVPTYVGIRVRRISSWSW